MLFHKKANEESIMTSLEDADSAAFKNPAELSKLVKQVVGGQECLMRCHLVKCENSLGRSTVIDLNIKGDNAFRQVDHRSIEYIILKNVKYVLRKGAKKASSDDDDMGGAKKDEPKWDASKLAVNNLFSGTRYFRAVEKSGKEIKMRSEQKDVIVS